ncbi:MAG: hypothetical protein ACPGVG_00440 [Mycobacterium sp.]
MAALLWKMWDRFGAEKIGSEWESLPADDGATMVGWALERSGLSEYSTEVLTRALAMLRVECESAARAGKADPWQKFQAVWHAPGILRFAMGFATRGAAVAHGERMSDSEWTDAVLEGRVPCQV